MFLVRKNRLFLFGFPVWDVWYLLAYPFVLFLSDNSEPFLSGTIEKIQNPLEIWSGLYWFGLGYLVLASGIGAFAFMSNVKIQAPTYGLTNFHVTLVFLFFALLMFVFQVPAFAVDVSSGLVSSAAVLVMALICISPLVGLGQAFVQACLVMLKARDESGASDEN